ncbi:MAG: phytoene dehydrogenase [Ectothiorhodospiraceae bacterium]|nr:phytoene dehydrogenase [Ectothiorhodospiraceae bacterium]
MSEKRKAIVIGAGFGGLSMAIRLQALGFETTIFEKNAKVGGHAYQMKKNGYTFDLGPSLITAPDIIQDIFASAGRRMEDYLSLIPLDPFYRIYYHDGSMLDYTGDGEAMKKSMAAFSEKDAAAYDDFMKLVEQLHTAVIKDGLGGRPFDTSTLLKFLPKAMRLKALQPTYNVVAKYFEDERNRFAFSFHPLFIGGSPFRSPAVYLMIPYLEKDGGVWFTKGGMYSLVQALEKLFVDIGGAITTNAAVEQILIENRKANGVRVNGENHHADAVVSNAHFAHTYMNLVPENVPRKWSPSRVKNMNYGMSTFLIYLGVKKQYPQLLHHTLILSKRYKELVKDIFDRKVLADDFSMYLHAPTRTDPDMAPPGCESMYVLVPVPNLANGYDWTEHKQAYADKIITFLEEWGLDDLRDNIEVMELFTPEDFRDTRNNYLGSAWGVEPRFTQTASFRPKNRSEGMEGMYIVGASTHPGAGVPGVMLTAEATEQCIKEDFGLNGNGHA